MNSTRAPRQLSMIFAAAREHQYKLEIAKLYRIERSESLKLGRWKKESKAICDAFGSDRVSEALRYARVLSRRTPGAVAAARCRRTAHRAPVRSIGLRTKSTRTRPAAKASSGDPDPVSPRRASEGGAW